MLTTNLSTRPFYNARAIRTGLLALGVLLAILSAAHLLWARSLAEDERRLSARATEAREQASKLLDEARIMRAQVNQDELNALSAAAREVNAVIDQRAFSWGTMLRQLEATLPDNVRVTAVQPAIEEAGIVVALNVEARNDDDLSAFMNALERRGTFTHVWPVDRTWDEDGLSAVIKGTFVPQRVEAPGPAVARTSAPGGKQAGR
jgi:Tfp pilus assembly protein PilN